MKLRAKKSPAKDGMLILMICSALAILIGSTALQYFQNTALEKKVAQNKAGSLKSHYCAKTAFLAAIQGITMIPENLLYQQGMMYEVSPMLTFGVCTVYFRVVPEDGKININHLINDFDSTENGMVRGILNDLFEFLNLKYTEIDKITDYIDADSNRMANGLEQLDYNELKPPGKVKNSWLFNIQEILSIPGFSYDILHNSRKPPEWDEQHSQDFATDIEKNMPKESDWILSNNLTAYATADPGEQLKVNINAAGYWVLRSLAPGIMTNAVIKKIFEAIVNAGFYLKDDSQIKNIAELALSHSSGVSNYDFYLKDRVKFKGDYYRIYGFGEADGSGESKAIIEGIFSKKDKELIYYKEF